MREQGFRFWLALGSWLAEFSLSRAFSFSYTAPKSCDPLNVTWTGESKSNQRQAFSLKQAHFRRYCALLSINCTGESLVS